MLLAIWGVLVCSSPSGWADLSARQIIDHLYSPARQLPIQDLMIVLEVTKNVATGEGSSLQPASRDKIFFKAPNKLRVDSTLTAPGDPMDGKQVTIIRDGVNLWMYLSTGQYPVKKGSDDHSPTSNLPYGIQRYPEESNDQYVVTGTDTVDGITTTVIRIVNQQNSDLTVTVWVDTSRWVPLKLERTVADSGENGQQGVTNRRILYKDIRQLKDGRFFPFQLEVYTNNNLDRAVVYQSVSANVGLQESLFQPLGGLK